MGTPFILNFGVTSVFNAYYSCCIHGLVLRLGLGFGLKVPMLLDQTPPRSIQSIVRVRVRPEGAKALFPGN